MKKTRVHLSQEMTPGVSPHPVRSIWRQWRPLRPRTFLPRSCFGTAWSLSGGSSSKTDAHVPVAKTAMGTGAIDSSAVFFYTSHEVRNRPHEDALLMGPNSF